MPFLREPVQSSSHRSWRTLYSYGDGKIIVQCRTAEGLKKNRTWAHRFAYKEIDLEPYRIIMTISPKERYIIAISQREDAIMKLWEELHSLLEPSHSSQSIGGGSFSPSPTRDSLVQDPMQYVTPSRWKELYQRIPSVQEPVKGLAQSYQQFLDGQVPSRGSAPAGGTGLNSPTTPIAGGSSSRQSSPPALPQSAPARVVNSGSASSSPNATPVPASEPNRVASSLNAPVHNTKDLPSTVVPVGRVSYLEDWALNAHRTWTWGGNRQGTSIFTFNSVFLYTVLLVPICINFQLLDHLVVGLVDHQVPDILVRFSNNVVQTWIGLSILFILSGIHLPSAITFLFGADMKLLGGDDQQLSVSDLSREDKDRLLSIQRFISENKLYKHGAFQSWACTLVILDFALGGVIGASAAAATGGDSFDISITDAIINLIWKDIILIPFLINLRMVLCTLAGAFLTFTLVARIQFLITNASTKASSSNSSENDNNPSVRPRVSLAPVGAELSPAPTRPKKSQVTAQDPVLQDFFRLVNANDWEEIEISKDKETNFECQYFQKQVSWCDKKATKIQFLCPNSTPQTLESIVCQAADTFQIEAQSPSSKKRKFQDSYLATVDKTAKFQEIKHWVDDGKYYIERMGFKSYLPTSTERDVANLVLPRYYLTEEEQEKHKVSIGTDELRKATEAFEPCVFTHAKKVVPRSPAGKYPVIPVSDDYERATLHVFGYMGQRVADGTLVTLCYSYDPCGLFPAFAVDLAKDDDIDNAKALRKLMSQIGPKEPDENEALGRLDSTGALSPSQMALSPGFDEANRQQEQQQHSGILAAAAAAIDGGEELPPHPEMPSHPDNPILLHAMKNYASKEWKLKVNKDGISWKDRSVSYCDKKALLFSTVVEGKLTPKSFEETLNDDKSEDASDPNANCYKYDTLLQKRRVRRRYPDTTCVGYTAYKSPMWGIAPRDMLTSVLPASYLTVQQQKEYGCYVPESERTISSTGEIVPPAVFVQVGIEPTEEIKKDFGTEKGFQRGAVHFVAWVVSNLAKGIKLEFCVLADPSGSLPTSLVEAFSGEQMNKVKLMKGLVIKTGYLPLPIPNRTKSSSTAAPPAALSGGQKQQTRRQVIATLPDDDESMKTFIEYYTSKNWVEKEHKNKYPEIKWMQMDSPHPTRSPLKALMFQVEVEGATIWSFDASLNDDKSPNRNDTRCNVYKYDNLLETREVARWINKEERIAVYKARFKSPLWGIAPREMQTVVHELIELTTGQKKKLGIPEDRAAIMQIGRQAPDDLSTEVAKKHCRGDVVAYGYLCFEGPPGSNSVNLQLVQHVDPSGSLPKSVVEATNGEQLVKMKTMTDLMKQSGVAAKGLPEGWTPISDENTSTTTTTAGSGDWQPATRQKTAAPLPGEPSSPSFGGEPDLPPIVKNYLEKLYNNKSWDENDPKFNKKKDIRMVFATVPWAKTKAVKISWSITAPAKIQGVEKIFTEVEYSKKVDPMLLSKEVIRVLQPAGVTQPDHPEVVLCHIKFKSPMWGIAARDMVQRWMRSYYVDSVELRKKYGLPNADRPDLKLWLCVGEMGDEIPADPNKKFLRGLGHVFGVVAWEKGDGSIGIVNSFSAEAGGSFPIALVDAANLGQFEKMEKMSVMIQEQSKNI